MKKEKITINKNELLLNSRKFTTSEIGRGTGVFRAKKGKGSYTKLRTRENGKPLLTARLLFLITETSCMDS
jgi:stalled ribosome alternative rescue factor ArfA